MSRRLALAALLAAAGFHLWIHRGQPLTIQDAFLAMSCAGEHDSFASMMDLVSRTTTPPLYPAFLYGWVKTFGMAPDTLRALSLMLFLGGAAALILALDRLGGRRAALLGAGLLALGGYPVWLSGMVRSYPLLFALSAWYLALMLSWAETPLPSLRRSALLVALAAALAHTQYLACFMMAGATAFLALGTLRLARPAAPALGRWIACHVAAAALFLPWVLYGLRRQLALGMTAAHGDAEARDVWLEFLWSPFRFFFIGLRGRSEPVLAATVAGLCLLFAWIAWKTWQALRKGADTDVRERALALAAGAGALGYLGVILASAVRGTPLAGVHYFSTFYPFALVAVALTLGSLPGRPGGLAALALVAIGAWTALPRPGAHNPWYGLAAWLAPRCAPNALVVAPDCYSERAELFHYLAKVVHRRNLDVVPSVPGDAFFNARCPEVELLPTEDPDRMLAWLERRLAERPEVWWVRPAASPGPLGTLLKACEGRRIAATLASSPDGDWVACRFNASLPIR